MMVLVILLLAIVVAMQCFINFASCGWYGKAAPSTPPPPRKETSATLFPPQRKEEDRKEEKNNRDSMHFFGATIIHDLPKNSLVQGYSLITHAVPKSFAFCSIYLHSGILA